MDTFKIIQFFRPKNLLFILIYSIIVGSLKYSYCFIIADEARGSEQGVLVHCLAGISRSVTITVAYLMQKRNLSLNEAYDYVKTCKPNISPNFNFMGQLLDFQKSLGRTIKCSCPGECTGLCCGADHPLLSDHCHSPPPFSPT